MKWTPSAEVRDFIIHNVRKHPKDVAGFTAEHFGISRQAASRHLARLVREKAIEAKGATRRVYTLVPLSETSVSLPITPGLEEDRVWRQHFEDSVKALPRNVIDICHHGFTEIFNNAVEHSGGSTVNASVEVTAAYVQMLIHDDGIGIFEKITRELGLDDHRHAILELSKGKLTTDPEHHTGEGIFFTSRMFDEFSILSGHLFFDHELPDNDWLTERHEGYQKGTAVCMLIQSNSSRTAKEVFDRYASGDDYGFTRTHVFVSLLKYGEENLVSRSQARRLLARFERFKEVVLDFSQVETIGQAFADEIFRVFRKQNPNVRLSWINITPQVQSAIEWAMKE